MRRPFHRATDSADDGQVNMTPMLDVVFIMLIFFMVTATFVREVGIDTNPPAPNTPVNPDARSIVVEISGSDRITIARREVDWRSVRANIERLHAEVPEAAVVIQSHPDSSARALVHVMDQSRLAGVSNISLADD